MQKDIIDQLITDWNKQRPELDVESMGIVGRVIMLGKILERRAGDVLKENGIYYTDLDVLATIRRSGFPFELTPKQLMAAVLLTSGAMTALLKRLIKLELIYRAPDKNDGRIILVGLTEKGILLVDKAIEKRFDEANKSVEVLDGKEREILSSHLRKLLISLDKIR